MNIDFSRKLIKGRITEVIFEQMLRGEKKYTVIPFGYEHTMPTLAQYRHLVKIKQVIDNIAESPDFVLISEDKTQVYLVEVKYQSVLNMNELKKCSEKLIARWEYPWLFVATPDKFYCQMCREIIISNDPIKELPESWVTKKNQNSYLKLLREFEK